MRRRFRCFPKLAGWFPPMGDMRCATLLRGEFCGRAGGRVSFALADPDDDGTFTDALGRSGLRPSPGRTTLGRTTLGRTMNLLLLRNTPAKRLCGRWCRQRRRYPDLCRSMLRD